MGCGLEPPPSTPDTLERRSPARPERRAHPQAGDPHTQGVEYQVVVGPGLRVRSVYRIAATSIEGLPVTTMRETILVLARDIEADVLTRVFDQALVSGKLDLEAMSATIDREAGRRTPGTPLLRRLTSSRMPGAPSPASSYLERLLEMALHDPRMPVWTRQFEFSLNGVPAGWTSTSHRPAWSSRPTGATGTRDGRISSQTVDVTMHWRHVGSRSCGSLTGC